MDSARVIGRCQLSLQSQGGGDSLRFGRNRQTGKDGQLIQIRRDPVNQREQAPAQEINPFAIK